MSFGRVLIVSGLCFSGFGTAMFFTYKKPENRSRKYTLPMIMIGGCITAIGLIIRLKE